MSGLNWDKKRPRQRAERRRREDDWQWWAVPLAGSGCWCGEPWGHDWPGKEEGAPHPR